MIWRDFYIQPVLQSAQVSICNLYQTGYSIIWRKIPQKKDRQRMGYFPCGWRNLWQHLSYSAGWRWVAEDTNPLRLYWICGAEKSCPDFRNGNGRVFSAKSDDDETIVAGHSFHPFCERNLYDYFTIRFRAGGFVFRSGMRMEQGKTSGWQLRICEKFSAGAMVMWKRTSAGKGCGAPFFLWKISVSLL